MRRAVLVLAALALALAVFACGGNTSARRITVWHAYRGDEERALKDIAARYEAERGVKVTLLSVPFDAYLSKLQAAVPRGNGPDVFIDAHGRLGTFTKEGRWLHGEVREADCHLCGWVAGPIIGNHRMVETAPKH